jgi:adenylate cyclase
MPHSALRFGPFVLDLDRLRLRGPVGEVDLRPKSFEVLRHLVERTGRVVPKEALIEAVWPDVTVTDDSLTRCISEVRRAIADERQDILKTVPRRGYLFDLPVAAEHRSADAQAGETTRPGDQPGRAEDDAAADRPFVAVLPFANLSGEAETDSFCDGTTEDIITELSRFSELRVIARHSSFRYKGRPVDLRQVGRELGVRYVLEGGIRRSGDRVRVTAQLVDATDGAQRWAERYDRRLEDVFAIQDEVARAIASLLLAHLRRAEIERTLLKPPATWRAYDHFVRGVDLHLAYQSSQDVAALHTARRHLEQAIRLDPAYARPYSALAISHLSSWTNYGDREFLQAPALERAFGFARQAVRLDPQHAHGQATFAWLLTWRREHGPALGALVRALRLNPSHSHWQVAATLMFAGELDGAVEAMEAYMRLDPFHTTSAIGWLGVAHCARGHLAEAHALLREAVARSPDRAMFHYWLAATLGHMGNADAAGGQARTLLALQPSFTIGGTARPLAVFRSGETEAYFLEGLRRCGLPG